MPTCDNKSCLNKIFSWCGEKIRLFCNFACIILNINIDLNSDEHPQRKNNEN